MDVFSYIDKAYKAMKLIKETIDEVKDAPDNLQLLRLRASSIEGLLSRLHQLVPHFSSGAADADLQSLAVIAAKRLEEIKVFLAMMLRTGENGDVKVNKTRFLQSKVFGDNIEDLSTKLDNLQTTLRSMCELVTLFLIARVTIAPPQSEVLSEEVDITVSAHTNRTSTPAHQFVNSPSRNRLRCLQGCACRCHCSGTSKVVRSWLEPFVGQVYVPKRRPCDVQTCRQDQTMPSQTVWYLPSWMVKVEAQVLSPFYLSIRTPRFVRIDAPIWQFILRADVDGLREQFKSGEASVHDVDEDGNTVLHCAHQTWFRSRYSNSGQVKASCDMIEFLADTGADPEFAMGQQSSMKLILALASFETLIEHPDAVFAHQVKTSTLAVDICQSIFHMDAIDLVEDYLERRGIQSDSDPVAAALLGYSSSTEVTLSDILLTLTGWTALEYAALYHPRHVESLLQRGEDATMGALVAEAADRNHVSIIKPLVAAGANVNAYNHLGMTALHYACYSLEIDTLKTLIQCAGEDGINWEARTRDGRNLNALQLAKASPFHSLTSTSKIQRLFDILRAHIQEPYEELHDGDEPIRMPGTFEWE